MKCSWCGEDVAQGAYSEPEHRGKKIFHDECAEEYDAAKNSPIANKIDPTEKAQRATWQEFMTKWPNVANRIEEAEYNAYLQDTDGDSCFPNLPVEFFKELSLKLIVNPWVFIIMGGEQPLIFAGIENCQDIKVDRSVEDLDAFLFKNGKEIEWEPAYGVTPTQGE